MHGCPKNFDSRKHLICYKRKYIKFQNNMKILLSLKLYILVQVSKLMLDFERGMKLELAENAKD